MNIVDESDVRIQMSDGVEVAVRIYRPPGAGPFPTLFAASPYRYDNDDVPPTMVFYWHEVGPIRWYVERGYAYVHLDVRGSGKSGGEYGFFNRRERRDLYEVIEWIAAQSWSNGKIGGIGQSYYAGSQWCMAAERPPHLTCIAPYDGHCDFYRGWFYPGGIQSNFASVWWNGSVRLANKFPANGQAGRDMPVDLPYELLQHPTIDAYWQERSIVAQLRDVDIPVFSIGVWVKRDLHLAGNILGYETVRGPKKLLVSGVPSLPGALAEFASSAFHEKVLLPFYDHYLKGQATTYLERAPVEYHLNGTQSTVSADSWPPPSASYSKLFLRPESTGSLISLNDGSLGASAPSEESSTSYSYPDADWAVGHVALTPGGPDALRRVLTFVSAPIDAGLTLTGAAELTLFVSSSRTDANMIVRLSEQYAQSEGARAQGVQPASTIISKGWLRASHRALDSAASKPGSPVQLHARRAALNPNETVELRVPLVPLAHRLRPGSRLRLEISCIDSTLTDHQFTHAFTPDMVGVDTIHHGPMHPSALLLPVVHDGN